MDINSLHNASCHCRSVQFEINLPSGLQELSRCNCSMCRRRGTIMASVPLGALKITEGEQFLSLYQFNTMTAKHYFCSVCGIYTYHQMRSNPNQYGFNVACLEGFDPFEFDKVTTYDDVNHESDRAE